MDNDDIAAVDKLLRRGALEEALDYVDERLLIVGAGLDREHVVNLRATWRRLRDRRLARGKKAPRAAS